MCRKYSTMHPEAPEFGELWLADYCCRCGKLFGQDDPVRLIRAGELLRPAHPDCTSREDDIVLWGKFTYAHLEPNARKR